MSVINAFLATWSTARQTYGEGTPETGAQYDNSSTLRGLESNLESAAPGSRWTGSAATNYDAANTEHRRVIGQLADLDRRLATEVDNSAQSVDAGRRNLDAARQWVVDAAASVPPGKASDQMRMVIAQRGLAQLQEIVQRSNSQSNAIGGRIQALETELHALGNQKFAEDKPGDGLDAMSDEKAEAIPPEKRAEEDVRATLESGDEAAADRVEQVLGSIKPYQQLTPEQAAYLNEMQKHQSGMSVADLKTAEDRLGDNGHVIGDSWQLMSNDDVPRSAGTFDEQQKGGFDRLPQSVQDTIKSPGALPADNSLRDIAAIVKDGNHNLQTGTELDRELIRKADRMMDTPLFTDGSTFNPDKHPGFIDDTVNDIFESAGRDHHIVHDHITGTHGDDGQDFLRDITTHEWNDDGRAAGWLFEWTSDTKNPIGAETASVYAEFLGRESGDLLAVDGSRQIGDMNPELVKAFANGLMPYQAEMVEENPLVDTVFKPLDDLGGAMDKTKGLFAVIDSQPDAAREFNRAAYERALDMQSSFAELAREDPRLAGFDTRLDDLQSSGRLLAVINGGMQQETLSNIENGKMNAEQALENAKQSHEFKKDILRSIFSYGRGGDLVTNTMADQLAGPEPDPKDFKFNSDGTVSDIGLSETQLSVQHQITHAQYTIANQFVQPGNPYIDPQFFNSDGSLKSPAQIDPDTWSQYDSQLTVALAEYTQIDRMLGKFADTFGLIGGPHK